jgi:hypothetical protein
MRLDDMLESKYLKQTDFPKPKLLTIKGVTRANLAKEGEIPEYKWTVSFEELAKPMVMNATNLKRCFKACGDDTDDWPGQQIVVYTDDEVEYAGKVVGGLRVRAPKQAAAPEPAPKPAARKPAPETTADDDFENDIPF